MKTVAVGDSINTVVLILGRLHQRMCLKYFMMVLSVGLTGIQVYFGVRVHKQNLEV